MALGRTKSSIGRAARLLLAAILLVQFSLLGTAHLAPAVLALQGAMAGAAADAPSHAQGAEHASAAHGHQQEAPPREPTGHHPADAFHCPFALAGGVTLPPPVTLLFAAPGFEPVAYSWTAAAPRAVRPGALPPPSRAPPILA